MHQGFLHIVIAPILLAQIFSIKDVDQTFHHADRVRHYILENPSQFVVDHCSHRSDSHLIQVSWRVDKQWVDICDAKNHTNAYSQRYWRLIVYAKYDILSMNLSPFKISQTIFR